MARVIGVIGGGVVGFKAGAAGGTVVLPGIGTITGAIGGAVFGATSGAIGSVASTLVVAAIDCIMYPKAYEEKYLTNEFFKDEMPELSFSEEEIELFNIVLNSSEEIIIKIVE